jgi:CubicO group peptidase (beta-lactamase class C family)
MRAWCLAVACLIPLVASESQAIPRRLDQYLAARSKLGQFNGTVLVAQTGRVVFEKGYGLADVANRVPASASTRYEVASITKMFTAAAILRLREAGKLALSDSLCRYLSECPDAWRPVTISHLLHHTSGVPDYENPLELGSREYMDYMLQSRSAERILEVARKKPLDFAPGTKFSYSNTAYILLGVIIEKVSGEPYREYLRTHVLEPAGMVHSSFVSGDSVLPRLATGYIRGVDALPAIIGGISLDERTLLGLNKLPLDGPHGDAALVTNARDLWRWTESLADSTGLAPASIREMFTPGLEGYGDGWFSGQRYGRRNVSHSGALPGFVSFIEWYPESRTTIVVLSNVVGTRVSRVVRDVAAIAFGKPYDVPAAHRVIAFDSALAAPLAGSYSLEDGTTATVSLDKDMIAVAIPDRFIAGALPLSRDEFYAPMFENTVRFERGANGVGRRIVLQIDGTPLHGERR